MKLFKLIVLMLSHKQLEFLLYGLELAEDNRSNYDGETLSNAEISELKQKLRNELKK